MIRPGDTLAHYRIERLIGQGGMGAVFLARDTKLNRNVALKVLPEAMAADAERLARFRREAQAVAALNHPHIVTIHSVEEAEGIHFLTMELVEGGSLDRGIPPGGLPMAKVLDIGIALADALAAAHEKGIVHRDLKPVNVMVTKDGRVKVLDFGLAKLAPERREEEPVGSTPPGREAVSLAPTAVMHSEEQLTSAGMVMGTVPYMSPEQLQGRMVDRRTDIFSLGVLLYELATGRRPFTGGSSAEIASAILRDEPAVLSQVRPDLPRQLSRILGHCLEKDRERRFQTAKDVRNELETLRGEVASATAVPQPLVNPGGAGGKRRRPWWPLGLAAGLLLAWVAYALYSRPGSGEAPAPSRGEVQVLAVLPLENLSGRPDEEYLAQGLTDALIAELAKVSALEVVPRMNSMRFRGSDRSLEEIARELGAGVLVEGSVQPAGDRVRINVELVRPAASGRLWNESYEAEIGDVLVLQSRIAREITGQIKVSLAPVEEAQLRDARPMNPEALRAYLKGRYYSELFTKEGFDRAIESFERAIALEPSSELPHTGLALVFQDRAFAGYGNPAADWRRASDSVQRALELNPHSEEALSLSGNIKLMHDWDWSGARDRMEAALQQNPRATLVRQNYSTLLMVTGKVKEGIAEQRSALAANPLSHDISCTLVRKYYSAGLYDEAIDLGQGTADKFPTCPFEHLATAEALIQKGRYDDAISHLEASLAIETTDRALGRLGSAYWLAGRHDEARAVLARLRAMKDADPYFVAPLLAAMEDREGALHALEAAFERRSMMLPFLTLEPAFKNLRDDPRFRDIVNRMGLVLR